MESLGNVLVKSFEVAVDLFKSELLDQFVLFCSILSESVNENIHCVEIFRLLHLIKLYLVALDLSLA